MLRASVVAFCLCRGFLFSTMSPEWESNSEAVDRAEQGPVTSRERSQGTSSSSWGRREMVLQKWEGKGCLGLQSLGQMGSETRLRPPKTLRANAGMGAAP